MIMEKYKQTYFLLGITYKTIYTITTKYLYDLLYNINNLTVLKWRRKTGNEVTTRCYVTKKKKKN